MTKRIAPYGYAIEDGCYTLEAEEAAVVQEIYSLYLTGESYARIADSLNHSGPAYHPEHPLWNKHIVKRILENSKYTGQQDYPQIIDPVQFSAVQALIASKSASQSRKEKAEDEPLWKYLSCTCGRKLCRTGGGPKDRSLVNLRCSQCETTIQISRTALTSAVLNAYNAYHRVESKSYTPSSEVIRLNNAIIARMAASLTICLCPATLRPVDSSTAETSRSRSSTIWAGLFPAAIPQVMRR